jgi:hypothetical protein
MGCGGVVARSPRPPRSGVCPRAGAAAPVPRGAVAGVNTPSGTRTDVVIVMFAEDRFFRPSQGVDASVAAATIAKVAITRFSP